MSSLPISFFTMIYGSEYMTLASQRTDEDLISGMKWPGLTGPPPVVEDRLYGVGVTTEELYTRKLSFEDWYSEDITWHLNSRKPADVGEVEDLEIQNIICEYLRYGGAKITTTGN
ncbi:hypothetical protein H109_07418 [Trichophyton interdigitale MR816]|uniref:Uncharacterized protein n=1 Tax=Trichophyton interdigitale (strain MR816) TaxID=1215338 RepID=A0A059IYL6_TRIIM|nr:hypothetical protein H101_05514 [Trichophyton interdigitale H6]KDB20619.1 hypothetical protein H109_07418 [Trichophyton interdigitale MR816]